MMQKVIFKKNGKPSDCLSTEFVEKPEPGKAEVRVKLLYSPIHNHDLMIIQGTYGKQATLPSGAGSEALGVVDAVGSEVDGLSLGQRVVVTGNDLWAEYFIVPARSAVPVNESIDDLVACQMLSMPLSAIMLLNNLKVNPGDWIILNAATGAVAKILAILAQSRKIQVISLVQNPSGVNALKEIGIAHAIPTDDNNWQEQIKKLIGDSSLICGVDSIGGEDSGALLSVLSDGAELITFGALSNKPLAIDYQDIIFKQKTIRGFWGAVAVKQNTPEQYKSMISEISELIISGNLKLPVDKIFPLSEIKNATIANDDRGRKGKILLTL